MKKLLVVTVNIAFLAHYTPSILSKGEPCSKRKDCEVNECCLPEEKNGAEHCEVVTKEILTSFAENMNQAKKDDNTKSYFVKILKQLAKNRLQLEKRDCRFVRAVEIMLQGKTCSKQEECEDKSKTTCCLADARNVRTQCTVVTKKRLASLRNKLKQEKNRFLAERYEMYIEQLTKGPLYLNKKNCGVIRSAEEFLRKPVGAGK